jgi:hypothetical protein
MSLERTIRPFQLPAVTPPALVLDDTKQADPVAVSLGREGGKTFDYSYSFSSSVHSATDSYKEVSRKTETKRIENPDDSDQFVEIKPRPRSSSSTRTIPSSSASHVPLS